MEKLTKLKNVFSKENIKKGVRIGVLTAGMAFTAMGLTSCGLKPCLDEECIYYEQEVPKNHTHDYCEEVNCDGKEHKGQDHDDYYNSGKDNEDNKDNENNNDHTGDTGNDDTKEKCNAEDCKDFGKSFEEDTHTHVCKDHCLDENVFNGDEHTHDYCDEYGCKVEGNETDDEPHEHCEAEDCKDYKSAYTGEHNHVCKDNCLDKNVFNGDEHTHEYDQCEKCDDEKDDNTCVNGSECENQWFKKTNIGGEGSPYEVFVIDDSAYNETNDFTTAEEKINDYLDEYIKHINGLTLNKELTGDVEINFNKINELGLNYKLDGLIGSTKDESGTIFEGINGINDICKPAIETITKNIGISGNDAYNMELDKTMFELYYRAIANEVYNYANSGTNTYTDEKEEIIDTLSYANDVAKTNYKIYQDDGAIDQEALQRFDNMINAAATKLRNQGKQVEVKDLYNIINLSFTASSIEGIHDYLSSTLLVNEHTHKDACYNNEMVDVIEGVEVDKMTPIAQAKLNKSIFSHDYGRELV